jgi:hypothetical protein
MGKPLNELAVTGPLQVIYVVFCAIVLTVTALAAALAWGPHQCPLVFPKIIGCALGQYETLASGLIAASAALIAGWLAWSGVQQQIAADERRASADRKEVERVLQNDVDDFADALGSIWRVLEGLDPEATQIDPQIVDAVSYGIDAISKPNWLSTSRRMVTVLGWDRRRRYDQLFDGTRRSSKISNNRKCLGGARRRKECQY